MGASSFSILGWIDWCLLADSAACRFVARWRFSILGWIDWCLLGNLNYQAIVHTPVFQYPRVDRLVSAGTTSPATSLDIAAFQYPRVDRLVSAGTWLTDSMLRIIWFQYPRVDRLVSAGPAFARADHHLVRFSILGWIDWCLLGTGPRLRPRRGPAFQYPRVDRLVSAGLALACAGSSYCVFQYPRVDRLVSAGQSNATYKALCLGFSILGWIDWCLLDERRRRCRTAVSVSVSSGGSIGVCWPIVRVAAVILCLGFSILGWIDWCLLDLPGEPQGS